MARGKHARDDELFAPKWHDVLRTATSELSWLRTRGYGEPSALKLVGDRHALRQRQRTAVARCACSDQNRVRRGDRRSDPSAARGRPLGIDGFNALITVEAALAGGLVLVGRDGAHRDLASVHGSYRRVATTLEAIALIGDVVASMKPNETRWFLDRPVSNSGKLRQTLEQAGEQRGLSWDVTLVHNPDRALAQWDGVVASSDGWILDRCATWIDLPAAAISSAASDAWLLDLGR